MPIRVEFLRQAVSLRPFPEDRHRGPRRLRQEESRQREARGVVDHHHQHAHRCTTFEPVVMAAVDLHQLTERGATLVMVTHDDHVAERCERVVRLRDGRVESDRMKEVVG